ncbi:hypothetical protein NDU88_002235 [Pleurodeles waltl]|uniref:Uncharacterized protein n=1 Tax=Pleurodeles waltl TaxID=8319 RepID=A0AAV7U9C9_PLEWA|nr:hypothetical protein NDU88_002235 [Pleurodeles waltl]
MRQAGVPINQGEELLVPLGVESGCLDCPRMDRISKKLEIQVMRMDQADRRIWDVEDTATVLSKNVSQMEK